MLNYEASSVIAYHFNHVETRSVSREFVASDNFTFHICRVVHLRLRLDILKNTL